MVGKCWDVQCPVYVSGFVVPLREVIPSQHLRLDDALGYLRDLPISDPDVVQLGPLLQIFATVHDDLAYVRRVGCDLRKLVPVARVDKLKRVMNAALGMNLHVDLESLAIICPAVSATQLDSTHTAKLEAFLKADLVTNVFGLGVLERSGIEQSAIAEWWGVHDAGGALVAAVYLGDHLPDQGFGLAVCSGQPEGAHMLGRVAAGRGGVRWAVGERTATDGLWSGLGDPVPRLKTRQLLLEATEILPGPKLSVKPAEMMEHGWVRAAARQLLIEDLGLDPAVEVGADFDAQVAASICSGAEYVARQSDELCFRAKVGTFGALGSQVGGIWVPPRLRGLGIGQAGTRGLMSALLQSSERVTLHVREDNEAALACYRAVGFAHVRDFRLLVR